MEIKVQSSYFHASLWLVIRNEEEFLWKTKTWERYTGSSYNPVDRLAYFPSKQEAETCLFETLTPEEWAEYIASKILR